MRRYIETFYRHAWLYLLPLALLLAAGAFVANRAVRTAPPYMSESTVAFNLDPTREQSLSERPPSQQYAQLLGELMETDSFVIGVLSQVTLEPRLAGERDETGLADDVRSRWRQSAVGANTMRVSFRCYEATFCVDFMVQVLTTYRDQVAEARLASRTAAVQFYTRQLKSAEERLLGIAPTDPGYTAARETYERILSRLVETGLEEELERQAGSQSFNVISPPRITDYRPFPVREALLPLSLGLLLGLTLTGGSVALAAWSDRSLRSPDDIFQHFALQTVAVVPRGWKPDPSLTAPTPRITENLPVAIGPRVAVRGADRTPSGENGHG